MELALLPAVESGFRPYSYSRSGAAGLWQFMPATGRMRGLTQDWWFDGRRDVIAGTEAALEHLESLHRRLDNDWLHALAAYNAGRGTVSRAVRKNRERGKTTDFWSLDLPGETDIYVPRLLALTEIIRDPQRFGVTLPELPDRPQFAIVDIGSQLDLGVAAKLVQLPVEDLAELNAGLNRLATPPDGPHRLLVPIDRVEPLRTALAELPVEQRLQRSRYRVKRGDTLSGIASSHGITVAALQAANGLQGHRIRAGQDLLVPRYPSALALAPVKSTLPHSRVHYRVRSGDSLYEIAQKFRVSVGQLRRWNRLSSNLLRPGQQLTLFVDPARQTL
jgi:membrane-bound lytic murein transglycosylase D